ADGGAVSGAELNTAVGEADVEGITGWTGAADTAYDTVIRGNTITCTFTLGSSTTATSVVCA
ncbi:MAG: hypothetical protein KJS90_04740, partial [Acidobacteria bacterium]|nr:hypothetical protein [Acidobacteriota bacterium]